MQKNKGSNGLLDAINEIETLTVSDKYVGKDIMEFCNSPELLNLPGNNFHLWTSQKTILKCFYMGSKYNENLKLNEEELEWLHQNSEPEEKDGVIYDNNIKDVLKKIQEVERSEDKKMFRELHLVLGRRGSKTIMASIITSYEVYKLLTVGNGNPHDHYGLPYDDPISIINVALSQKQAGKLFEQIQARIRNSPFFEGRIAKEAAEEIRIYTDSDLDKVRKGTTIAMPGSISIVCGHSNYDSLRGSSAVLILFDELAFFEEKAKVSGRKFYNALKPSLAHFHQFGEGRLVEISSPNTADGIFYDIFKNSKKFDHILSFQLPTWSMNPGVTYDHPDLIADRESNPDVFAVEYGAQWARGGTYGNYFPEGMVDRCLRTDLTPHEKPRAGYTYYLHVDPAKSGNRYVALLLGRTRYKSSDGGKTRYRFELANVWAWDPQPGIGLIYKEIDNTVMKICRTFHPSSVTYDQYNSVHSLQFLKRHAINCRQMSFNRGVKNKIYQNLKDLMAYLPDPEIVWYDEPRLILEMKSLKFRPTLRGLSLLVDKHGEVNTDDIVDCLAGAAASANNATQVALPASVTVQTGFR